MLVICALGIFVRMLMDKDPAAERGVELLDALLQAFDCFSVGVPILHNTVKRTGVSCHHVFDVMGQQYTASLHDVH